MMVVPNLSNSLTQHCALGFHWKIALWSFSAASAHNTSPFQPENTMFHACGDK